MSSHDPQHDRQSQAGASGLPVARGVRAVEALEDLLSRLRWHAVAVVADLDDDDRLRRRVGARGRHTDGDLHRRPGGGVAHHVAQQVGEDLGEAVAVTDDLERGGLLAGGLVAGVEGDEAAVALGGQHHHVAEGPGGQVGEVDRLHRHLPALVDPGQLEEIVDEAPHARGLGLDAVHDLLGPLGGHPSHAVELAVAAYRRQGGAQLVRGVRDESGHAFLGDQLDVEGLLVTLEHRV